MIVLLLGLDGRVHLGRMLAAGLSELPTPGVLAVASVVALYAGRAAATWLMAKHLPASASSVVRVIE
jgi:hypothetical protein